jgi:UDP:flavonoid glycosyltransferase YjiC (YdhE family)
MPTLVFYVSGHGFGHAARVIEIINAIRVRRADVRVIARTSAASWLFDRTVIPAAGGWDFSPAAVDTGVVQIDSLHIDERATVERAREFLQTFDHRVAAEAAFLQQEGVALVVADMPPLGIAAAKRAGLRAVALGNFTWDWIYSAYEGADDVVRAIQEVYRHADIALRLPLHGGFDVCPTVVDVPFVARRSQRPALDTRRTLGLPERERLVLVSFGGYGLDGLDLDALTQLEGYRVLMSGSAPLAGVPRATDGGRRGSLIPLDEGAMYEAGVRYEDLIRSVDVVVTKPGYGIIAESVANDTAILYTSRGHFVEYDVLVAALPRFLRARYLDHADLFAGRWSAHLDALLEQPAPPEHPAVNGAEVAAELLLDMI